MFKELVVKTARRIIRSFEYEQELDTVFYFLNSFFDIRDAKPATGELRKLQKCDAALLAIFHKICQKAGLPYWIDGGTLLGMHRHGGFIPWDDDIDVCMLREDYDKALKVLPDILRTYGIEIKDNPEYPMSCFGLGYMHEQTGIWLDVFPVDQISGIKLDSGNIEKASKNIRKYSNFYHKNRKRKSISEILQNKEKIREGLEKGQDTLLFLGVEYDYPYLILNNIDNVFPVQRCIFEGSELLAPGNVEKYLESEYGNNYMQFPRNGVVHHGNNNGKLYEWATVHSVDLDEVLKDLNAILNEIEI